MSSPTVKFLVTGSTSGLGASVLDTLYKKSLSPSAPFSPSDIAASSSRPEAAAKLQESYPGTQFRVVDYNDRETLTRAFAGVEKLLFVSSPEIDVPKRQIQHANVVDEAVKAAVGHVYYTSLAFGGYGSDSKSVVQLAHLTTEELLQKSGIPYTSVREGVYADAFPVYVSWYPDTTKIFLPIDGSVALASRDELGEATANLMLRDPSTLPLKNDSNIVLLTGARTYTFTEVVAAISKGLGKEITIERIAAEQYSEIQAVEDAKPGHGGKPKAFFDIWYSLLESVGKGEVSTVDPLFGELLGREPKDAMEHIVELVRDGALRGGYTWHQNY
ncbi:hypothetical protein AJ80_09741 [Polytolypa hystricis UAMH7299]|uniref:NmrA-like domain-containing protein n=1 Tax=Polytolypa hystricis (strain UAMH7299) TaxID=1447883 RepID=A0A2B7WKT4_POLH7|nr:hypothetical protein AJ80_09741 [Polytolypa hystricis UAMH7299]